MIIFSEILPNPIDANNQNEWIKLYNTSNQTIDLTGWKIKDISGKTFVFPNKEIAPNSFLILFSKETKIILNNSGDSLFLYNQSNQLIDKVSYDFSVAKGDVLYRGTGSFILKPKIQNQNISLTEKPLSNQVAIVSQKLNPTKLGLALSFILVLSLIFFLIIKKINLFYEN